MLLTTIRLQYGPWNLTISEYLSDFISLLGIIISALIAIIIFTLSIRKDRKLAREQLEDHFNLQRAENKADINLKLSTLRLLCIALLEGIINSAKTQKQFYEDTKEAISTDMLKPHSSNTTTQEHLKRFLTVDTEKLIFLFQRLNIPNNHFLNLLTHLSYLDETYKNVELDFSKGNGRIVIDLANQFIQTREEILQISRGFIFDTKNQQPDTGLTHSIFMILSDMIVNYNEKFEDYNFSLDRELVVDYIRNTLAEEKYYPHKLTIPLLTLAQRGGSILHTMSETNNELLSDLNKMLEIFNSTVSGLEDILSLLKHASINEQTSENPV